MPSVLESDKKIWFSMVYGFISSSYKFILEWNSDFLKKSAWKFRKYNFSIFMDSTYNSYYQ